MGYIFKKGTIKIYAYNKYFFMVLWPFLSLFFIIVSFDLKGVYGYIYNKGTSLKLGTIYVISFLQLFI